MLDSANTIYDILINLKTVQQELKSRVHSHFKDMNLTAPQGMLLFMLNHHGSMKITEISEKMGLSNSTVSGIVDRLEVQGLVERKRSDNDRRVVNVTVTKRMKNKLASHENIMDTIMKENLSYATEDELVTIASGLATLNNLLQKTKKEI